MIKYVQLEMIHVSNNQVQDPYTSTKYPHRFFNMQFENEVNEKEKQRPFEPEIPLSHPEREKELIMQAIKKNKIWKRQDYDSYLHKIFPNISQHV